MARHSEKYENNPFYIGLNGLKMLFNNAQSVAVYAIVLIVGLFLLNTVISVVDSVSTINTSEAEMKRQNAADAAAIQSFAEDPARLAIAAVLVVSALFLGIVIWLLLYGILEYTSAQLALGKKAHLKEAFKAVWNELASYVWLSVLIFVKVLLWSLLFIIPGIIMAIRYSLSGTVFFAEGKRGNAAIKRSLQLTKGAWFTTFAGTGLWNLITFNQATSLIAPGANAVLYRQLRDVTDANHEKPAAHWLSWLTFFVPIALILLFILFIALLVVVMMIVSPGK